MSQLPIIQVYVSYSTVQSEALEELEAAFQSYRDHEPAYQMEVKYSENNMQEGDSIVAFMDEIAAARFVVLLFSKEYFESPYCLYELIRLYEAHKENDRFSILSIKLGSSGSGINTYTVESIINAWKGEEISEPALNKGKDFCQNKLRELLQLENSEINDTMIESSLQEVHTKLIKRWLGQNISEKNSDAVVQEIAEQAQQAFEVEKQEFDKMILRAITSKLAVINSVEQSWENCSGFSANKAGIASCLVEGDYIDSLSAILDWAESEKRDNDSGDWPKFFNTIQKISGWLILKSIKQDWWIHNKLSYKYGAKNQGYVQLPLEENFLSYSEVIISKSLARPAQFLLDETGHLVAADKADTIKKGNQLVFDCNKKAVFRSLLEPIITDLRKEKPRIADEKDLLEDLYNAGKANLKRKNRQYYFYLVTQNYLQQLKACKIPDGSDRTLLNVINEALEGTLFFIAIEETPQGDNALRVADDVSTAISFMESILRLDK